MTKLIPDDKMRYKFHKSKQKNTLLAVKQTTDYIYLDDKGKGHVTIGIAADNKLLIWKLYTMFSILKSD